VCTGRRGAAVLGAAALALLTACSSGAPLAVEPAGPRAAEGYRIDRVVTGSALHGVNGLTVRPDGRIVAAGLASETVTEIDPATGAVTSLVGSPQGRSDDVVVAAGGDVLWTDPLAGSVKRRGPDGTVRTVADGLPGVNSIAFDREGERLYVGQTFLGDALWEIDPAGVAPKRRVVEKIGQPNAFAFGPDGQIYAPVGKRKAVVRIDPRTGATADVATGFTQPVSVRFDSRDRPHVLDGATGELLRIDPATGERRTVAMLPAADDNMIITPDDHAYVSVMADSAVLDVDLDTGARRTVTSSPLAFPSDVAAGPDGVVVADATAVRVVDGEGRVREVARRLATEIQFPVGVSVHGDRTVLTSELIGGVQVLDATGHPVRQVAGLDRPADAVELADGALVVAEPGAGRLVRVDGAGPPRPLATGLGTPTAVEVAPDGRLLVTDAAGGRLLGVDAATGAVAVLGTGLGVPRGAAPTPDGAVVVLDGRGRVQRVEPGATAPTVLAEGLPTGYLDAPYPRSGGVAVTPDGRIVVAADKENSLYAIRRG
jgi:sugar lactone lactonase YvrE